MDFTACQENKLYMYGGGNGKKIGIAYDGAVYMLKFIFDKESCLYCRIKENN